MDSEALLRLSNSGNRTDVLFNVKNTTADSFGMKTVLFTRASLWSLCGFGSQSRERYLDDQAVNSLICLFLQDDPTISKVMRNSVHKQSSELSEYKNIILYIVNGI